MYVIALLLSHTLANDGILPSFLQHFEKVCHHFAINKESNSKSDVTFEKNRKKVIATCYHIEKLLSK